MRTSHGSRGWPSNLDGLTLLQLDALGDDDIGLKWLKHVCDFVVLKAPANRQGARANSTGPLQHARKDVPSRDGLVAARST
jgi:hypothetical protein